MKEMKKYNKSAYRLEEQIADFRKEMEARFDEVLALLQTGEQELLFMLGRVNWND